MADRKRSHETVEEKTDQYLTSIYYSSIHPARYGSEDVLYWYAKKDKKTFVTRNRIKYWLSKQGSYTKFRKYVDKVPRRQAIVRGYFYQVDADLAFMEQYAKQNNGYKYILVAVDTLSKYMFAEPLKTKKHQEVKAAFSKIFAFKTPTILRTDKGTEFVSDSMKRYFKSAGVHPVETDSDQKAFFAEMAIKTLKVILY